MRRSPSKIGQTAAQAAKTGRKSLEMTPQPPQTALKRQHRRSRRRCSDVPYVVVTFFGVVVLPIILVFQKSQK